MQVYGPKERGKNLLTNLRGIDASGLPTWESEVSAHINRALLVATMWASADKCHIEKHPTGENGWQLVDGHYKQAYLVLWRPRATSYSYWEWQNWGYPNSETPEPIVTKFGMVDYVSNMICTPTCKLIVPVGASRQMSEISLSCGFKFFCDPKFCSLNGRTNFYAVWFTRCQSQVIAFLLER